MTISPRVHGWHRHPGVRSDHRLSPGERAADAMRNGMGSWTFVFCALAFLAAWMLFNGGHSFDRYPFILLNLVLSCLAACRARSCSSPRGAVTTSRVNWPNTTTTPTGMRLTSSSGSPPASTHSPASTPTCSSR
jgi:Protein of unknown function (DUF1003)